ncbi:GPW/gp25 family protein [Spirosoma knui]
MPSYSLQTPVSALMRRQPIPKVATLDAIRQHINLLLTTKLRECRYDPEMGCAVWDQDYANITNPTLWKSEAETAFVRLISQYEKRIRYTRVSLEVDEPVEQDRDGRVLRLRKRLTIRVSGTLIETGESMPDMEFVIYFSPVSSD